MQTLDSRMLSRIETGGSVFPLCHTRACGSVCSDHGREITVQALDCPDNERDVSTREEALSRTLCTPLLYSRHAPSIQQGSNANRDMQTLREGASGLRWPSGQDEFRRRELDGFLGRHLTQPPCEIQGPPGRERTETHDPGASHSHLHTSGRRCLRSLWRWRVHLSGRGETPPKLDWHRASRLGSHSKAIGGELFPFFQSGTTVRFRGSLHP